MSYTKLTDFAAKDALPLNNAGKYIKGTEIGAEFDALQTADALSVKSTVSGSTSTLTVTNSITLTGTSGKTYTFPTTDATLARIDAANTFLGTQTFSGLGQFNLGLNVAGAIFTSRGITDNATATALTLSGSGANSVTIMNSATNPTIGTSAGSLVMSSLVLFTGAIGPSSSTTGISINSAAITYVNSAATADNKIYDITSNTSSILFRSINDAYTQAAAFIAVAGGYGSGMSAVNLQTSSAGSAAVRQVAITHTASADRYITLTGSNGANPKIGVSDGQLTLGTGAALATNATVGHICIPTCAGTPTGVPTNAGAGNLPIIYDTTNNFLYIYNGGWKKSTVYA